MSYQESLVTLYILLVQITKERGKNPVGKSSLKHGDKTKFWKYFYQSCFTTLSEIPSSDLRLLKVFSENTLVNMSATCSDAQ